MYGGYKIKKVKKQRFENVDLNPKKPSQELLLLTKLLKDNKASCKGQDYEQDYKTSSAKLIHNEVLETKYSEYKKHIAFKCDKNLKDQLGFYVLDDNDEKLIHEIAELGCPCVKRQTNILGGSEKGIYLVRSVNHMVNYFNQFNRKNTFQCVIFQYVVSYDHLCLIDPNAPCQICETTNCEHIGEPDPYKLGAILNPSSLKGESIEEHYLRSLIYLYEFHSITGELEYRPRCVKPFALLTFERTRERFKRIAPQVKRKVANYVTKQTTPIRENESRFKQPPMYDSSEISSSSSFEQLNISEPKSILKTPSNELKEKPKKSVQINLKKNQRFEEEPRVTTAVDPRVARFAARILPPSTQPFIHPILPVAPPANSFYVDKRGSLKPPDQSVKFEFAGILAEQENLSAFDLDGRFKQISKAQEAFEKFEKKWKFVFEDDRYRSNISRTHIHFEKTGKTNVKFKGVSKLKVIDHDSIRKMKFTDNDETTVNTGDSTNKLILLYDEKKRKKTANGGIPTLHGLKHKLRDFKTQEIEPEESSDEEIDESDENFFPPFMIRTTEEYNIFFNTKEEEFYSEENFASYDDTASLLNNPKYKKYKKSHNFNQAPAFRAKKEEIKKEKEEEPALDFFDSLLE